MCSWKETYHKGQDTKEDSGKSKTGIKPIDRRMVSLDYALKLHFDTSVGAAYIIEEAKKIDDYLFSTLPPE